MNKRAARILLAAALAASAALADDVKPIFQSDFQRADAGQIPDDYLVLDGDFAVQVFDGKKYLELPGAPLDSYGALFGPSTNCGVAVSARVFGTGTHHRFPTFAVGLNGGEGYKLQVSPAKGALEIYKGDVPAAAAPFKWKSGAWTLLRLRVRQAGPGDWKIEGKAWLDGAAEPADWLVTLDETNAPAPGRASIWGSPFSGTPIRYDHLVLTPE